MSAVVDPAFQALFVKAAELRAKGNDLTAIITQLGQEGDQFATNMQKFPELWAQQLENAVESKLSSCLLDALNAMQNLLTSPNEKIRLKAANEITRLYMFKKRVTHRDTSRSKTVSTNSVPQEFAKPESFMKTQAKKMFTAPLNSPQR